MLNLSIITSMEKALNAYIALDGQAHNKLTSLAGKTMGLNIKGLNFCYYIIFQENHLFIQSTCLNEPDLFISAPPFSLLALFQSEHPQALIKKNNIEIKGDILLAQDIGTFFKSINIDWEYYASHIFGDIATHEFILFLKNGLERLKDLTTIFSNHASEYVQEELKLTPHPNKADYFFNEVDKLRSATDLLEKRINHLTQEIKKDDSIT